MYKARSTPHVVVTAAMFLLACQLAAANNGNGNGNTTTTSSTTTTTSTAATTTTTASTTTTSTTTSTTTTTTTTVAANTTTTLPNYPLEVCTTNIDPTQSGSAAAVTNSNIVQNNSTLFASYYNYANLNGDLKAFTIDASTGNVSSTAQWSAQAKLGTSRTVYTYDPSATSTPKQLATSICSTGSGKNLTSTAWVTYLNASSITDCQNVITDLLGGTAATGLRTYQIGTIVHSEPVYVPGLKVVIQAANDGMVHAFNHDDSVVANNNNSNGTEAWAYIPRAFLTSIGQGSPTPTIDSYARSSYTTHQYWLDATPWVDTFATSSTSGNTTTTTNTYYLSTGFAKGAKGIFSLNIGTNQSTNKSSTPTITTSPTPLWAYDSNSDSNVGYLYGRPIITQVTLGSTLTQVVIFAGGFNAFDLSSLSSSSYLYVVNLSTGALIKKFTVSGHGLNYIAGYADSYSTLNQAKYVYGGDLDGNVWRFDLTATDSNSWTVHKLASLGAPISSEPELSQITVNGTATRFVYVGTGRYLTPSDLSSATGSLYGLIDRIDAVTNYNDSSDATVPSQLSTVALTTSNYATSADPNTGTASNISTYGWVANLPTGQRVINTPAIANGKVLFSANQPADPCSSNMGSWLYIIDYQTGLQTGYFSLAAAATSQNLSTTSFLASRPTVVKLSTGDYRAMIRTTSGDTLNVDVGTLLTTSGGTGITVKGMFWREIITQ